MKTTHKLIAVFALGLGLYGCATSPKLSQEQIQQQYQPIAQLKQAVQTAQHNNVDLLAPEGYATAEGRLSDAFTAAQKGQTAAADKYAKQGLDAIEKARRDAGTSADILSDVLEARTKALDAGAQELYTKDLATLEKDLSKTAALIEKGDVEEAKQIRPELSQHYTDLELKSVKEGTVQRAKAAIARARDNDADKLAPKTFKRAQESLAAAISVLEADRTARDRAEAAAHKALIEAERSENIAEMVRDFKRRDSTQEDIVLWYQDQLADLASPLNKQMNFTEANKQTVSGLQQDIASLIQDRQRLTDANAAMAMGDASSNATLKEANAKIAQLQQQHQQEISQLNEQHQQEVAQLKKEFVGEKTELTQAQIEREARFKHVQQLFSKDEAIVYRQGDNVLISVQGFKFPPGSSEIQPQNFGIMNKIVQGIAVFNAAQVKVEGHTDITGSDEANLTLSQQRAQNVARFLTDVGHIPAEKIVAEGFGSQKPVASNATPEGRAENRRIEVLIVNDK
jgi:OOP family OmpA-OmpF porin